jgi:hypothetical protein
MERTHVGCGDRLPLPELDYTVDSGTLAWLVAISVGAAILFSLAPIGRVLQLGVNSALKSDARGVTQGLRGKHLAEVLVAGQMALAIVLLSGAGVLVRSLLNVVSARTGVRDPENILVGSIRLPSGKYPSPATRLGYFDRLEAKLRTVPGIQDESVSSSIPVGSGNLRTSIGIILGLAASLAVNRILQSQLVGVSPYDPVTMTGAPVVLTLVARLACQIPARRAMNVDPAIALRHD